MDTAGIKEMLTYLVGNLVEKPEEIRINTLENGNSVTLQLRVAAEDMGRVIGRQGRIAKEIRTLIKAMGLREDVRVMVDILD
jgi:Predicted RNA-binding protein (contains KH domain)